MATKGKKSTPKKAEKVSADKSAPIETTPVEKKKKHSGHEYNPDCGCAVCKSITVKQAHEAEIKQKVIAEYIETNGAPLDKEAIIKEFVASLDAQDKMIFWMNQETKEALGMSLPEITRIHGELNLKVLEEIANIGIINYCKSLIE